MSKLLKIITAGDGGVGKTTLLYRYVENRFLADTKMTLGVEFFLKETYIKGETINLQVWDFGGQDHFRPLLKDYSVGAKGALLLFDLTRPSSLENIEQWVNICRKENPELPVLFLGTKADLVDDVCVDAEYIKDHQDKFNLYDYMAISAKTGENVENAFESLTRRVLDKILY